MDVREGASGTRDDRRPTRIHWDGEYIEVNEPERLVFTVSDQPDQDSTTSAPSSSPTSPADRTEMLFQQSGGHMPAEATAGEGGLGRHVRY